MTKKASLPGRRVSLFALAEALCARKVKIDLLSRGSEFEGKYTALWPDVSEVSRETEEVFNSLIENHENAMTELVNIAEEVRELFLSMTEETLEAEEKSEPLSVPEDTDGPESSLKDPREYSGENEEYTQEKLVLANEDAGAAIEDTAEDPEETEKERVRRLNPEKLEKKFRELQATEEFQALLESAEKQGHSLRQFRHKISLAFQNTIDGELNLLFTGDVQPQYMKMIAENYDGKIQLYEHYWCIKVPHHGTESHFFDFSGFSPENMMIPNGAYYDNSKKKSKNQRTSMQYGGLFYINDAHMYCSNCDCCDSYENGCSCREYDVISPSYYKDI